MDCLGKGGSHTASSLQSSKNKNLTPPIQNKGGIQLSYKPYHILFFVTNCISINLFGRQLELRAQHVHNYFQTTISI